MLKYKGVWEAGTDYPIGSVVIYTDNLVYHKQNTCPNNEPPTDTRYWSLLDKRLSQAVLLINDAFDMIANADPFEVKGSLSVEGALTRGLETDADTGVGALAFGNRVEASGDYSQALGCRTEATGDYSYAEGYINTASGQGSHAEGNLNKAFGDYSHAEGMGCQAVAEASHAEGNGSVAQGKFSHASGYNTKAVGAGQFVCGIMNVEDTRFVDWHAGTSYAVGDGVLHNDGYYGSNPYVCIEANSDGTWNESKWKKVKYTSEKAFIVGNGSGTTRSNAFSVGWDGSITIGGTLLTEAKLQSLLGLIPEPEGIE